MLLHPFLGKTLTGSLFLSQVAYLYETCRNVVFQTSTPLPNLVEMAGELQNYEGTQTGICGQSDDINAFPEKVKLKVKHGLRLLEVICMYMYICKSWF